MGNSCFFNSTLQCLASLQVVMSHFNSPLAGLEGQVTREFRRFIRVMTQPPPADSTEKPAPVLKTISPRDLLEIVCKRAPRFKGNRQQDAHELLRYLLDLMQEEELAVRKRLLAATAATASSASDATAGTGIGIAVFEGDGVDVDAVPHGDVPATPPETVASSAAASVDGKDATSLTPPALHADGVTESTNLESLVGPDAIHAPLTDSGDASVPPPPDASPMLSGLESSELEVREPPVIPDQITKWYGGRVLSTIICTGCGGASLISDPYLDVSLEIPRQAGADIMRRSYKHGSAKKGRNNVVKQWQPTRAKQASVFASSSKFSGGGGGGEGAFNIAVPTYNAAKKLSKEEKRKQEEEREIASLTAALKLDGSGTSDPPLCPEVAEEWIQTAPKAALVQWIQAHGKASTLSNLAIKPTMHPSKCTHVDRKRIAQAIRALQVERGEKVAMREAIRARQAAREARSAAAPAPTPTAQPAAAASVAPNTAEEGALTTGATEAADTESRLAAVVVPATLSSSNTSDEGVLTTGAATVSYTGSSEVLTAQGTAPPALAPNAEKSTPSGDSNCDASTVVVTGATPVAPPAKGRGAWVAAAPVIPSTAGETRSTATDATAVTGAAVPPAHSSYGGLKEAVTGVSTEGGAAIVTTCSVETLTTADASTSTAAAGVEAVQDGATVTPAAAATSASSVVEEVDDVVTRISKGGEVCGYLFPKATAPLSERAVDVGHTLADCFGAYTGVETIKATGEDGYFCVYCQGGHTHPEGGSPPLTTPTASSGGGGFSDAAKRMLLDASTLPPVLTLQLKRFGITAHGHFAKISGHVAFPEVLDVAPYTAQPMNGEAAAPGGLAGKPTLMYRLAGVVVHSGGLSGGHYIALVRWGRTQEAALAGEATGQPSSTSGSSTATQTAVVPDATSPSVASGTVTCGRQWMHVSDSVCTPITLTEVLAAEAYLLFYERVAVEGSSIVST